MEVDRVVGQVEKLGERERKRPTWWEPGDPRHDSILVPNGGETEGPKRRVPERKKTRAEKVREKEGRTSDESGPWSFASTRKLDDEEK
ncbi:hypothetical protein RUM44_008722 [Polyplax serrata]|uniref:Uncharacterized protein n=1 Tax=Polyplax serrata TaxID=468196 RepID=A0ABR1BDX4_POLSC